MTQNLAIFAGMAPAFTIQEKRGLALHLAANVYGIDGSGGELQQWLKLEMRSDLTRWLTENGRLPSTTISEYFEEIQTIKNLKNKEQELLKENEEQKEELAKYQNFMKDLKNITHLEH